MLLLRELRREGYDRLFEKVYTPEEMEKTDEEDAASDSRVSPCPFELDLNTALGLSSEQFAWSIINHLERHRGRAVVIEKNAQKDSTRVLLVEDHSSFRQALAFMFEREEEFVVVGQAGTLAEAYEFLSGTPGGADVAIVDLGLPDGDGFGLIQELASTGPGVMTLVLSASLEPARFAHAVEAGASGVLHKAAAISDIVGAVRRLKAGEALLSPDEIVEMLRMVSRKRQEEYEAQKAIDRLTPRERQVLQALSEGLDSKEIARKLNITVETERTHMVNILNKLGVHSRLQALVFAARHGVAEIR